MARVIGYADGFNLYHSTVDPARLHNLRAKWLNIRSLCSSLLYVIGEDARSAEIDYFSAFAHHLNDPDVVTRHCLYVDCLESTGVVPSMARFKPEDVAYPPYNQQAKSRQAK